MALLTLGFPTSPMLAVGDDPKTPRLQGVAVPFGVASDPAMDGNRYRFSGPPTSELVGLVAVRNHDDDSPIGFVSEASSSDEGIAVVVDLLDTTGGRDSHVEASAGVRTGFSVAFDPIGAGEPDDEGVIDVTEWEALHLGHVRHPAFGEHTQAVAASKQHPTPEEGHAMSETIAPEVEAPAPTPVLTVPRPLRVPSLAEYGFAVLHRDLAKVERYNEAINLAAGDTLVSNIPGVIPTPIVGPVLDARPYDRPIVSALGPSAGPSSGASWTHPIVSDPIADAAAVAELASANDTLGLTPVSVSWTAIKRSTIVSRETQIYSEPSVMGIIGDQLARAYARGSEVIAAAAVVGAAGGNTAIVLALNGSDAAEKIIGGSAVIYGQVGSPADLLIMNPTDYAKVAGWKATDGRALFPSTGQVVNGSGTTGGATSFTGNIAGVPIVVSWALAAGQNFLLASDYVRSYEGNRASISVESAAFGVTVGVFGTVATKVLLPKAMTPVSISATVLEAAKTK